MTSQNALYKKVISKLAKNAKILLCKNKIILPIDLTFFGIYFVENINKRFEYMKKGMMWNF